ncbi:MAG: hypothetical protein ACRDKX_09335 [Solirubrobacterales bacterium]
MLALFAAVPAAQYAVAVGPDPGEPIDNGEQRVSEHGFRFGADQFLPDISATTIVWQDQRGTSTTFEHPATGKVRNRIWFKDLDTRDEALVATLSTDFGHPRVSGKRIVWHDFKGGDHDIFTRKLPAGPIKKLTANNKDQMNPAIKGNVIVWEDYRNGNADIFQKVLGGAQSAVEVASGNQVSPSISGSTIAWRDSRRGSNKADVWIKDGANPSARAVKVTSPGDAKSFSPFEVAISGTRLLWNEADPACTSFDCTDPKVVKTCVLPAPCATTFEVDSLPTDPNDRGALTSLDVSGSRGSWVDENRGHLYTVNLTTCDPAPCAAKAEVDAADGTITTGALVGNRFAWSQDGFPKTGLEGGLDVIWDDRTTVEAPRRANSVGLGPFARHENPVADGDIVVYRAPAEGDFLNETQVWATDLSGTREHFAVSTELGTDISRPAVVGTRAAWSDLRNCPSAGGPQVNDPCETEPADDALERDPLDSGAETLLSDPAQTGGPVDADGSTTVWRCGDTPGANIDAICVHDGVSVTRHDIPADNLLDPASTINSIVRISGDLVAYGETFCNGECQSRVHVLDLSTGDDEIVGAGAQGSDAFTGGQFDISGSTVIFGGDNGSLFESTVAGCGGTGASCDNSADAALFEPQVLDHGLSQPAIDGDRVAWVDCPEDFGLAAPGCDIYTRTLSDTEANLVTNETNSAVRSPYVDDANDRIYWVDERFGSTALGGGDVFMESVDDAISLPPPDTTAPTKPTGFTATPNAGAVDLAWTNPSATDFFRVRILRKSGPTPPSSLNDTSAAVIYEDDGESFTDTDVKVGQQYSYRIVAFDLEPNYSGASVASTP